jgi:hypothetical protein
MVVLVSVVGPSVSGNASVQRWWLGKDHTLLVATAFVANPFALQTAELMGGWRGD